MSYASVTYLPSQTVIGSAWLNNINQYVFQSAGSTSARPAGTPDGWRYLDKTLLPNGLPIWSSASAAGGYVNAAGQAPAATFNIGDTAVSGAATFTNSPVVPTPAMGDNTTKAVTSAWVQREIYSILAAGGKGDGVTDNAPAINAILAASGGRALIVFPPGVFVFNSGISYTFANATGSVTLIGAGSDVTELRWPGNNIGLTFNYLGAFNSVHIRDMSITTGANNTQTGVVLNQTATSIPNPANSAENDFTNVTFRGSDGYGVNHVWAFGIDIFAVSNINYSGCNFVGNSTSTQGVAVRLRGLNAGCQGVVSNFDKSSFTINGIGIVYDQWYQGVTAHQCNFTGGPVGIQAPLGAGGQDQLIVSDCQINCATAGLQLSQPIPGFMITNSLLIMQVASARGITCSNYTNFQILGCQFGSPSVLASTLGIYFNVPQGGAICGGVITGNSFVSLTNAIELDASSTNINVQSNRYPNCVTPVLNAGTGNTIGGGSI